MTGDLIAKGIVMQAADALATAVKAVATQLGHHDKPFPIVLSGSLLQKSEFYRRVVIQAIQTRLPVSNCIEPISDAAEGAALLVLEQINAPISTQLHLNPLESTIWSSEQRNLLTQALDLQSKLEIIGSMHVEDLRAVMAVRTVLPTIANVIDKIARQMGQEGRLIYVGAETSGRLGALDAAECPPTFGWHQCRSSYWTDGRWFKGIYVGQ